MPVVSSLLHHLAIPRLYTQLGMVSGFLMSLLPDPATCQYVDIAPGAFDIDQWIGQFGCMCISGTVHDSINPPIREHNLATRRLRYIKGSFTRVWTTIPEIVIGVVSG
jgi:hypothetical protein